MQFLPQLGRNLLYFVGVFRLGGSGTQVSNATNTIFRICGTHGHHADFGGRLYALLRALCRKKPRIGKSAWWSEAKAGMSNAGSERIWIEHAS